MKPSRVLLAMISPLLMLKAEARACDLCAIYNTAEAHCDECGEKGFRLRIAEQFTGFDKVQQDGRHVDNARRQHLHSSITQVVGAYDLNERFGLQLSLPYINRRFKRSIEDRREEGRESGIGDMTLLATFVPLHRKEDSSAMVLKLFAGIKLPTGESDRLREDAAEDHHGEESEDDRDAEANEAAADHDRSGFRHGGSHTEIPSAIHGHDLASGSGSFDFPLGASILAHVDRILLRGNIQYTFRTEGDHSYEYADDLIYSIGPAYNFPLSNDAASAFGFDISGEYKREDTGADGRKESDTGTRSLFLGPKVQFALSKVVAGEVAVDLPLDINNTGFQAVPTYRVRSGITFRF